VSANDFDRSWRISIRAGLVLLVAADTFRAAAIEQLELWASRIGAECYTSSGRYRPFRRGIRWESRLELPEVDVVIIDTAGRLHVKANLIEELKKVVRVVGRQQPGAPHEVFLVIDATTGQNAVSQARVFQEALSLTGIILTKLDGTAKGGTVLAISSDLGVPIRYIGYGEGVDEFSPFDPDTFVEALLQPPGEGSVQNPT
jgi:fused signal recognition particle receptor